jgi:hemerythrin-like domain-containing protein
MMGASEGGRDLERTSGTEPDDPFVPIFREHTELQMLATRLHELASQLERGERVPSSDLTEALEVHRRFLVGVHHRRESMIATAVGSSAGPAVAAAFERCRREHPKAERFESDLQALLDAPPSGAEPLRGVAALLQREADRIVEHDRQEDEAIHRIIHHTISASTRASLVEGARELAGEAAAAEGRLSSWTSHSNPAAD